MRQKFWPGWASPIRTADSWQALKIKRQPLQARRQGVQKFFSPPVHVMPADAGQQMLVSGLAFLRQQAGQALGYHQQIWLCSQINQRAIKVQKEGRIDSQGRCLCS